MSKRARLGAAFERRRPTLWTRNFTKVITLKHQQKGVLEARIMKTKGAHVSLLSQRAINFHILSATPVNYFHKLCERRWTKFRLRAFKKVWLLEILTRAVDVKMRERTRGNFSSQCEVIKTGLWAGFSLAEIILTALLNRTNWLWVWRGSNGTRFQGENNFLHKVKHLNRINI